MNRDKKVTYTVTQNIILTEAQLTNVDGVEIMDCHCSDEAAEDLSSVRKIFPQILTTAARNLILINVGAGLGYPTIIIPYLINFPYALSLHRDNLYLTQPQASWLITLVFILLPFGSLFSVWITSLFGRRLCMLTSMIPSFVAWMLLFHSAVLWELFLGIIIMGFSCGYMLVPAIIYPSEISQRTVRGAMLASTSLSILLGACLVYVLGSHLLWRTIAGVCAIIPLLYCVLVFFMPETPIWLLTKKRQQTAYSALQWLRGWTKPKTVEQEFIDIEHTVELVSKCMDCQNENLKCYHPFDSIVDKLKQLTYQSTYAPLLFMTFFSLIVAFSGYIPMRPYLIQIFQSSYAPIDSHLAVILIGVIAVCSNILGIIVIRFIGRRIMALTSCILTTLVLVALCIYAKLRLPDDWHSYNEYIVNSLDIDHYPVSSQYHYTPMILIFLLALCANFGLFPVQWMLMGEIFPFRSRELGIAISVSLNYLFVYFASKSYLSLEEYLRFWGVALFFAIISLIGCVFIFFLMPETEQIALVDIEKYYSNKKWKIGWTTIAETPNHHEYHKYNRGDVQQSVNGIDNQSFQ